MSKTETQSEAESLAKMLEFGAFSPNLLQNEIGVRKAAAEELRRLDAENKALRSAERTLQRLGYQDRGGQEWAPPIGKAPDFDLIDSLRSQLEQESAIRQHGWSIHYADERDFCLAASPLIGATYVDGAAAVKRLNNSPWGLRHFGVVRATGPSQSDTPQAAAKNGGAA